MSGLLIQGKRLLPYLAVIAVVGGLLPVNLAMAGEPMRSGQTICADQDNLKEVADVFENVGLMKMMNVRVIDWANPKNISAEATEYKCTATATLSNATEIELSYRFHKKNERWFVEVKPSDNAYLNQTIDDGSLSPDNFKVTVHRINERAGMPNVLFGIQNNSHVHGKLVFISCVAFDSAGAPLDTTNGVVSDVKAGIQTYDNASFLQTKRAEISKVECRVTQAQK